MAENKLVLIENGLKLIGLLCSAKKAANTPQKTREFLLLLRREEERFNDQFRKSFAQNAESEMVPKVR